MEILWEVALAVAALIVAFCLLELVSDRFGAPWAPTSRGIVRKMLVLADINPGELLYDLGSGDGRIILQASREFHARSVGIEINPLWVFWARLQVLLFGLRGKTRVVWGNLFNTDLSGADVVTLYLHQGTTDRLKAKLEQELKPGARVISHSFTFKGWEPAKTDSEAHIYAYKISK